MTPVLPTYDTAEEYPLGRKPSGDLSPTSLHGNSLAEFFKTAKTMKYNAGKLIVLTGPSGVGKGTLVRALLQRHPQLYLSISVTTRSPRPGEIDGKHYYFRSREQFEQMVARGELLEWAEFAGNYYGTPRLPAEEKIAEGKWVLLEIELQGARQIRSSFPDALRIFILPPSLTELEQRLRGRGQDSEEAMRKRLRKAQEEIDAANEFDFQIINDDLETALKAMEATLFASCCVSQE